MVTVLPYIVFIAPNPGSSFRCSGDIRELLPCGKLRRIGIPGNSSCGFVHSQEVSYLRQARACVVLWVCHDCCISRKLGLQGEQSRA